MSTPGSEIRRDELVRLTHFWRQRYLVEAFSTFNLGSRVLNSDEITIVGDPIFWQGTPKDVNAALNSVLGLGLAFFYPPSCPTKYRSRVLAFDVLLYGL